MSNLDQITRANYKELKQRGLGSWLRDKMSAVGNMFGGKKKEIKTSEQVQDVQEAVKQSNSIFSKLWNNKLAIGAGTAGLYLGGLVGSLVPPIGAVFSLGGAIGGVVYGSKIDNLGKKDSKDQNLNLQSNEGEMPENIVLATQTEQVAEVPDNFVIKIENQEFLFPSSDDKSLPKVAEFLKSQLNPYLKADFTEEKNGRLLDTFLHKIITSDPNFQTTTEYTFDQNVVEESLKVLVSELGTNQDSNNLTQNEDEPLSSVSSTAEKQIEAPTIRVRYLPFGNLEPTNNQKLNKFDSVVENLMEKDLGFSTNSRSVFDLQYSKEGEFKKHLVSESEAYFALSNNINQLYYEIVTPQNSNATKEEKVNHLKGILKCIKDSAPEEWNNKKDEYKGIFVELQKQIMNETPDQEVTRLNLSLLKQKIFGITKFDNIWLTFSKEMSGSIVSILYNNGSIEEITAMLSKDFGLSGNMVKTVQDHIVQSVANLHKDLASTEQAQKDVVNISEAERNGNLAKSNQAIKDSFIISINNFCYNIINQY